MLLIPICQSLLKLLKVTRCPRVQLLQSWELRSRVQILLYKIFTYYNTAYHKRWITMLRNCKYWTFLNVYKRYIHRTRLVSLACSLPQYWDVKSIQIVCPFCILPVKPTRPKVLRRRHTTLENNWWIVAS